MTLTPEQFNKLATKEDLKDLATKTEMNEKFDQVLTAFIYIFWIPVCTGMTGCFKVLKNQTPCLAPWCCNYTLRANLL